MRSSLFVSLLIFALLLAAGNTARAWSDNQNCQEVKVCVNHTKVCSEYAKVCVEPVQICKQYSQVCVKQEKKCIEHKNVTEYTTKCVQYAQECAQYAYKTVCKEVDAQSSSQYWVNRWNQKQDCQKVQSGCAVYQENKNKCVQYEKVAKTVTKCTKHAYVCSEYAQGKCLQYTEGCKQFGEKCAKSKKVCSAYAKQLVCSGVSQQQQQDYVVKK
ncbi:hypothetical protein CDCA_CDCA14G3897 [Cyanidium caldarium]|uniref:Uncharacterized protein n=1 Tax=Cyanidium caldarium TaxID=2771 RepID=A0AAV9IZW0_CYACA|nr:hypothetical protein CDCA_CDCA14G3897 [Cyanidium caldarium]